ncbi:MAG: hypothetical protein ABIL25_09460 [candidate division WOR-3 bacterium]
MKVAGCVLLFSEPVETWSREDHGQTRASAADKAGLTMVEELFYLCLIRVALDSDASEDTMRPWVQRLTRYCVSRISVA